jgi:hypothetical protein
MATEKKLEEPEVQKTSDNDASTLIKPKSKAVKSAPGRAQKSKPAAKISRKPTVGVGGVRKQKPSKSSGNVGGSTAGVSKRPFPQHSIDDCIKLINVIKEFNAGNPWTPRDIAGALKIGPATNSYFYLTAASRDYGLTIGTRDTPIIELTDLGRSVVYPKSQNEYADALESAFRNVDLFSKVYNYYQGKNLPDIQYLKNTLKTEFGVEERFQDEFYALYQNNLTFLNSNGTFSTTENGGDRTARANSDTIILGESRDGSLIAFVAMPFSEKTSAYPKGYFDEVLKHLITPAAVKANFNARTANKAGSEVIQSTIVNDLDSADLVIVDLTEHNPNVLFELGMRIAFDKPVCLIRAKGTAPIFDIDHMLRVYDYNPSMWPSTLETDIPGLSNHIAETWKRRDAERSYLKILRDNKNV